jgi:CBS domain-containing protein
MSMNVEQLMTSPVETCNEGQMLDEAARIMWEHDCGAVPVVDHEGRPIAMITDRDICMAGLTQGVPLSTIPVATAMSKRVLACHRSDSIATAESTMRAEQVRRLPIVGDGGRLVGILSLNDIATRGLSTTKRTGMRDALSADAVAATLAAICSPPAIQQASL